MDGHNVRNHACRLVLRLRHGKKPHKTAISKAEVRKKIGLDVTVLYIVFELASLVKALVSENSTRGARIPRKNAAMVRIPMDGITTKKARSPRLLFILRFVGGSVLI
jgi:hypothetical protein